MSKAKSTAGNFFEDFKVGQVLAACNAAHAHRGRRGPEHRLLQHALCGAVLRSVRQGHRLPAGAARRPHHLPRRARQDRSRHLAQRGRQPRLCGVPLPQSGLPRRHVLARAPRSSGCARTPTAVRRRLRAHQERQPARRAGSGVCALGDGQQARPAPRGRRGGRAEARVARRSGDHRQRRAEARPFQLRLRARRLAASLGRLRGRREDRPHRRLHHRGGRAPARDAPLPEHRARALQSARQIETGASSAASSTAARHLRWRARSPSTASPTPSMSRPSTAAATRRPPSVATRSTPGRRSWRGRRSRAAATSARCACGSSP